MDTHQLTERREIWGGRSNFWSLELSFPSNSSTAQETNRRLLPRLELSEGNLYFSSMLPATVTIYLLRLKHSPVKPLFPELSLRIGALQCLDKGQSYSLSHCRYLSDLERTQNMFICMFKRRKQHNVEKDSNLKSG